MTVGCLRGRDLWHSELSSVISWCYGGCATCPIRGSGPGSDCERQREGSLARAAAPMQVSGAQQQLNPPTAAMRKCVRHALPCSLYSAMLSCRTS